ncbi:MAG: hypothetical protein WA151_18160 [Desulfatirhabdiaceae bacterium]
MFEIYKNKLAWTKYEIYYDETDGIPGALLKSNESEIKRAKTHFENKELDCCTMLLRKEFERFLINPLCHHDTAKIFIREVKAAIDDLEKLIAILKIVPINPTFHAGFGMTFLDWIPD